MSWYFMKYKNDSDDLIQSDLEELRKEEPPKSAGLLFEILILKTFWQSSLSN